MKPVLETTEPPTTTLDKDELSVLASLRALTLMNRSPGSENVAECIDGIRSLVAGLSQMAVDVAQENPAQFERISVIIQYIGSMVWQWNLRKKNNTEMLGRLEQLGRASASIGEGLFPLDDKTRSMNRHTHIRS